MLHRRSRMAGGTAQPAAQFRHLSLNLFELPLVTDQSRFHSRTIELESHELDYKFMNSFFATGPLTRCALRYLCGL